MKMDDTDYKVVMTDTNDKTIYEKVCHGINAAYEFISTHFGCKVCGYTMTSLEAGNAA